MPFVFYIFPLTHPLGRNWNLLEYNSAGDMHGCSGATGWEKKKQVIFVHTIFSQWPQRHAKPWSSQETGPSEFVTVSRIVYQVTQTSSVS